MEDKYLTVTQLNRYIKYKFDNDANLQSVFLKGEISNFKNHTTGHFYFTLKDENSRILAVMFRNNAMKVNFTPQDGSKVLVVGRISCYEANGNYQIYVEELLEDGVGNLYLEFEKLKKKLQEKGYFDQNKKKPIPKYPKKIGVVTAPTGAAIRDIITTINRRYPLAEVYLFPALVQGDQAKEDIVKKIKQAENYDLDVLLVGRGGGSIEDLWAFNEEIVAQAIYDAKVPIISGVGHEIDFTIADFVADLRAPTPTAAAELAVPSIIEIKNEIKQMELRATKQILNIINNKKQKLDLIKDSYILKNPMSIYEIKQQKIDGIVEKLELIINKEITNNKNKLKLIVNNLKPAFNNELQIKTNAFKEINNRIELSINKVLDKLNNAFLNTLTKLETLSPISTIKRGYAVVRLENKVISDIALLKKGDIIETQINNGLIKSKIEQLEEKNE